jgi:hypothetical protein
MYNVYSPPKTLSDLAKDSYPFTEHCNQCDCTGAHRGIFLNFQVCRVGQAHRLTTYHSNWTVVLVLRLIQITGPTFGSRCVDSQLRGPRSLLRYLSWSLDSPSVDSFRRVASAQTKDLSTREDLLAWELPSNKERTV